MKEKEMSLKKSLSYLQEMNDIWVNGDKIIVEFDNIPDIVLDYDAGLEEFLNIVYDFTYMNDILIKYDEIIRKKNSYNTLYLAAGSIPLISIIKILKNPEYSKPIVIALIGLVISMLWEAEILNFELIKKIKKKSFDCEFKISSYQELMREIISEDAHPLHSIYVKESEVEYVFTKYTERMIAEIDELDKEHNYIKTMDLKKKKK